MSDDNHTSLSKASTMLDPFDGFFSNDIPQYDPSDLMAFGPVRSWMRRIRWTMENDLYTYLQPLDRYCGAYVNLHGRSVLLLSSYNYLGLVGHEKLLSAAIDAARDHGTSTGGVRLLTGSSILHLKLEQHIANFLHVDSSATFSSGFAANTGVISALLGPRDVAIVDACAHQSIHDGCKQAGVKVKQFQHNDVDDLSRILKDEQGTRRKLIIVEGLYSMHGDICPLPEILDLKRRFSASLMIDEAHSLGVLGPTGRGVTEYFNESAADIDLITGSLSKAIASSGGFVAGREELMIYLKHGAGPFMFSGALAPPAAAAADAALTVLQEESDRLQKLRQNGKLLREGLMDLGYDIGTSESPLVPVVTGSDESAYRLARELFRYDIAVSAVVRPAAPKGGARLRLCATSAHKPGDIFDALDVFAQIRRASNVRSYG